MTVKVGDSVLYGKYSGTEITVDGKEYLIMRESDILAIFKILLKHKTIINKMAKEIFFNTDG